MVGAAAPAAEPEAGVSVVVMTSRTDRRRFVGGRNSEITEPIASVGSPSASRTSSWKLVDMRRISAMNRPTVRAACGKRCGPRTTSAMSPTRNSFSGLKFSIEASVVVVAAYGARWEPAGSTLR